MKVVFLKGFEREVSKVNDKKLAHTIKETIDMMESISNLTSIPNLKKLKGYRDAYRVRIGNYRIGFYYGSEVVTFAAFGHRKDIYKKFP